jgi:hypothetical protein
VYPAVRKGKPLKGVTPGVPPAWNKAGRVSSGKRRQEAEKA